MVKAYYTTTQVIAPVSFPHHKCSHINIISKYIKKCLTRWENIFILIIGDTKIAKEVFENAN